MCGSLLFHSHNVSLPCFVLVVSIAAVTVVLVVVVVLAPLSE